MNLARQCPDLTRRALLGQLAYDGPEHIEPAILASLCAANLLGGAGSSKSDQRSTNQQTAASEGSLAVGASGKFLESGSVDLSGAQRADVGTKLNAGGDISISSSDPDVLKAALQVYDDQASKALDSNRDLSLSSTTAFSSFAKQLEGEKSQDLATLLTSLGDLKQTTDEQAQQRKTFLYLMLGVLGLFALIFVPWGKVRFK